MLIVTIVMLRGFGDGFVGCCYWQWAGWSAMVTRALHHSILDIIKEIFKNYKYY